MLILVINKSYLIFYNYHYKALYVWQDTLLSAVGCNRIFFLLQNLLSSQHVPGTIMSIIRSSRVILMVAACDIWCFGLQAVGLVWSCRLCVRVAGCWLTGVEQHTAVLALYMKTVLLNYVKKWSNSHPGNNWLWTQDLLYLWVRICCLFVICWW